MTPIFPTTRDFLGFLIQALLVLVAIAVAWLFYRYVRSVTIQNRLVATRHLADAAIDYVEDLDRRGDLDSPAGVEKGAYKRDLAARWLKSELRVEGARMGQEQAQTWIAAAFQKRVGDTQPPVQIRDLARQAVDLTQTLDREHLVEVPPNVDHSLYLANFGADWITVELAKEGLTLSHEQAMTWVRGEILHRLQLEAATPSTQNRLDTLAEEAVQFMSDLRSKGRIAIRPAAPDENVEADIATAWLIKEVATQGLEVTSAQISEAISKALSQTGTAEVVALPARLRPSSGAP